MRLLRVFLPLILLATSACASMRPDPEQTLRVMTYNIHAGKDAGGVDNLERVATLITSSGADLVLLQEVDRGTTRSGRADQLEILTRLTKMHGAFGKSLDFQGGDYGIATLSRWPIAKQETVHLAVDPPQERSGGSYEPRVALIIETRTPGGLLTVVNTHLDASRDDRYRLQEVAHLLDTLAAHGKSALVVGGDFNAEPGSAVHAKVLAAGHHDSWEGCGSGSGLSFPASAPVKRIDYLFLSRVRCASATVLDTQASDHRPVIVEMTREH